MLEPKLISIKNNFLKTYKIAHTITNIDFKDFIHGDKNTLKLEDSSFSNFMKNDKKLLTFWVGSILKSLNEQYSIGCEIKVSGGSRSNRIPLTVMFQKKVVIFKIVNTYKDISSGLLKMQDIVKLIKKENLPEPKIIIIPMNYEFDKKIKKTIDSLSQNPNFSCISIKELSSLSKNSIKNKNIFHEKLFSC